jgi:hypothetical protein
MQSGLSLFLVVAVAVFRLADGFSLPTAPLALRRSSQVPTRLGLLSAGWSIFSDTLAERYGQELRASQQRPILPPPLASRLVSCPRFQSFTVFDRFSSRWFPRTFHVVPHWDSISFSECRGELDHAPPFSFTFLAKKVISRGYSPQSWCAIAWRGAAALASEVMCIPTAFVCLTRTCQGAMTNPMTLGRGPRHDCGREWQEWKRTSRRRRSTTLETLSRREALPASTSSSRWMTPPSLCSWRCTKMLTHLPSTRKR